MFEHFQTFCRWWQIMQLPLGDLYRKLNSHFLHTKTFDSRFSFSTKLQTSPKWWIKIVNSNKELLIKRLKSKSVKFSTSEKVHPVPWWFVSLFITENRYLEKLSNGNLDRGLLWKSLVIIFDLKRIVSKNNFVIMVIK